MSKGQNNADALIIGAVPAGRHTVTMQFKSAPTRTGLILSLAGLVALAGLAMLGRRRPSML